jgi:hypothetical protein
MREGKGSGSEQIDIQINRSAQSQTTVNRLIRVNVRI